MVRSQSHRSGLCMRTGVRLPHWLAATRIVFGTLSRFTRLTSQNNWGVCSTRRSAESGLSPQYCCDLLVCQPKSVLRTSAASSSPVFPLRREFTAMVGLRFCVCLRGTFRGLGMVRKAMTCGASMRQGRTDQRTRLLPTWRQALTLSATPRTLAICCGWRGGNARR